MGAPRLRGGLIAACLIATLALGSPPAGAAERARFFGVVDQRQPSRADFEAMRKGGVATYRWLVSWPTLQRAPDAAPDWSITDRTVGGLAKQGIEALPMIQGSPCFVVDCERIPPPEGNSQPPIGSQKARAAWADFLSGIVARYGPAGSFWSENPSLPENPIRTWQIWNEQNTPQFYRPSPSARGYAELVRLSAEAIRSRDPGARILLGGMFENPRDPAAVPAAEYLQRLYSVPGAKRSFDAVASHPFSSEVQGVARQVVALRRVMDANGDSGKPIWVTEVGWGSGPPTSGRLLTTPRGQARKLAGAFRLLLANRNRWRVARVLWFSWRDTTRERGVCRWCASSGLVDVDLNPKPAWRAFKELTGGARPAPREAPKMPRGADEDDGLPLIPVLAAIAAAIALVAIGAAWEIRRRSRTQ